MSQLMLATEKRLSPSPAHKSTDHHEGYKRDLDRPIHVLIQDHYLPSVHLQLTYSNLVNKLTIREPIMID